MFDFEGFMLEIARLETEGFSAEELAMTQKEVQNLAQNLLDLGVTDVKGPMFGNIAFDVLNSVRLGVPLPEIAKVSTKGIKVSLAESEEGEVAPAPKATKPAAPKAPKAKAAK